MARELTIRGAQGRRSARAQRAELALELLTAAAEMGADDAE
jgi:hypothetical protein